MFSVMFTKVNIFSDFLFASLEDETILKGEHTLKGTVEKQVIPLTIHPHSERRQNRKRKVVLSE